MTITNKQILWVSLIPLTYINMQWMALTYIVFTAGKPLIFLPWGMSIVLTGYVNYTIFKGLFSK